MSDSIDSIGARPRKTPLRPWKKVLFSAVPFAVLLGTAEAVLRWTGAAQQCSETLTDSVKAIGQCHPILGYTAYPGRSVHGQKFNTHGFRSREFVAKPPGVYRILSLGDSCTFGMTSFHEGFFAPKPYPQKLEDLAAERLGPGKVEVLNAGMGGYNTFHGLMLLRTMLRDLEPDLITVRFGWNDHFMGRPGARLREPTNRVALAIQDLLLHTDIYRFAMRLGNEVRVRNTAVDHRLPTEWTATVPTEDFRRNLRRIVEVGRSMGAEVWLVTAPDPFTSESQLLRYESLPEDAEARRAIRFHGLTSFRRLMEIHRQYAAIVREVGQETGAPVVDMIEAYGDRGAETLFTMDDPVHPRQNGYSLEAETLYQRLVAKGWPPAAESVSGG